MREAVKCQVYTAVIEETCKKIESDVDNSSVFSEKRYKMICQIQEFLSEGCSYREIAKRMGVGRNTIAKYREGDPKKLNMYGIRQSKLDIFYDFIIQCLDSKWSESKTIKEIYAKGYTGSKSNAFEYLCKIEQKENKYFEVQPYIRTMTEGLKYRTGSIGKEKDYIIREGIFRYMWMNTELTVAHKNYIYAQYPAVWELHCCIKEFRNIFKKRNVPLLYLFIEKYCKSMIKAVKSFAEGLKRDIVAVENAVAYDYSNGFVNIPDEFPSAVRRYGNHFLDSLLCILNHNFYRDICKGCYAPQMRQGLDKYSHRNRNCNQAPKGDSRVPEP